jgi:glycosyltransferase involved in cell wall biosynthesis
VESLGSGTESVLRDYVRGTPEHEHLVLGRVRGGTETGEHLDGLAKVLPLPAGTAPAVRAVGAAVRACRPDLVHAHSSFGGAYARLSPAVTPARTVLTPHCYGFERLDLGAAARGAYWAAEQALAVRTGTVVAVSPREAALARRLARGPARRTAVHLVPNAVRLPDGLRAGPGPGSGEVVTAGRLVAQKDPGFFARAAQAARATVPGLRWTWLGDGDPAAAAHLRAAGVDVAGWLPRAEVLARMATATAYVHTAAWESCPVTLLEAAALGLPVVARSIPALEALDLPDLAGTPEALAARVLTVLDGDGRAEALASSAALVARHSPQDQLARLRAAYDATLAAAGGPA